MNTMKTVIETVSDIFESRNTAAQKTVLDAADETCLWFCTEQDGFTYSAFLRGGKTAELRKFLGERKPELASGEKDSEEPQSLPKISTLSDTSGLPEGMTLEETEGELFCAAYFPADRQLFARLERFSETARRLCSLAEASVSR